MSDPATAESAQRLPSTALSSRDRSAFIVPLTLAAIVVRAAFLWLEPTTHPVADELTWTNWATQNLITPKVSLSPLRTHMIFYPPLYPYFIAVWYLAFGSLAGVQWAQVMVSALLVPAVGRIGAQAFSPRVGALAAGIVAFYPELVWFSAHFWSEILFMVFLWWAVERLLAADAGASVRTALVAGLLWGIAILTRETALYFTPLAALWLAGRRERGLLRGAAFLMAACLTVAPWTLRNWLVFHALVPVSTAGGLNLFQGNARLSRQEVYDLVDAVQGRIEQYRYARRMGLQAIWDRQPSWIFEKLFEQMPNFWEADSLVLIHVKRGAYGPVSPGAAVMSALVVLVPYFLVLAFMVVGIATIILDRPRLLLIAFLAYYNLIHVVTHGFARYRLPIMPVVFLLASAGFVAWRERRLGGVSSLPAARWRIPAAAVTAVVLVASVVPSIVRNFHHPAFGFADQGAPAREEPTSP
jgi:Dolichyl-phosphate-mannose-protein mannosyltransferase